MSRDDGGPAGETPRTDAQCICPKDFKKYGPDLFVYADFARDLERELSAKTAELDACRADAIEQARLVGMGAEREARLMAQLEACRADAKALLQECREDLFRYGEDSASAWEYGDSKSRREANQSRDKLYERIDSYLNGKPLDAARREG